MRLDIEQQIIVLRIKKDMENFTPLAALTGGMLIGLATTFFLLSTGKVLGVSGMVEGMLTFSFQKFYKPATFVVSLVLGAFLVSLAMPDIIQSIKPKASFFAIALAGLLMGFGARIGSGCTSGHGISGMARLSPRSIFATIVFFSTAAITVYAVRYVPEIKALIQP